MAVPQLPPQIVADFYCDEKYGVFCTPQFLPANLMKDRVETSDVDWGYWDPVAAYGLEFGVPDKADRVASLKDYWGGCESAPWAFDYFERSNGYSVMIGLIARSPGLFISQQTLTGESFEKSIRSFNIHISPILGNDSAQGASIVVYSRYRGDAYILSCEEDSWDESAPSRRILKPIPENWGIVWTGMRAGDAQYKPRGLDEIASAGYSAQISACANCLKDCLAPKA